MPRERQRGKGSIDTVSLEDVGRLAVLRKDERFDLLVAVGAA
jgi:hypothetical protein